MSRRIWSGSVAAVAAVAVTSSLGLLPASGTPLPAAAAPAADPAADPGTDTTITLPLAGDTWVASGGQTSSQATSPELRVGPYNLGLTKARTYLDFDYTALAGVPAGAVVTSAQLTLSNFVTGSCKGSAIRVSRITGAWTLAGVKWSAQPATTATGSGTSTAAFGANGCTAEGAVTFDVSGIVKSWLGGGAKRGVQVKADPEGSNTGYRKYRSAENGDAAKAATLTVTYDSYPDTPTALKVSPGVWPYTTSLTPTLSAKVSDPDAGTVRSYFEVRKGLAAGSPVVWSGLSEPVEDGETATVTVPAGVLTEGTSYAVAAYGYDGRLASKSPASQGIAVDVTAPEVTITSDVFTDGEWRTEVPASATFTLDGSPDTGAFTLSADGSASQTVAAGSSGDYTSTWKPTPGWHTITATPVDRAGNVGEPTTFGFGTGAPSFTAPTEWEGSTADFPVHVSGPPNATGASLSWRVWGEQSWHTAAHLTKGDAPWDGTVSSDGGPSTTGLLTWHATQEQLGTGTLKAPALIQVHACFTYAGTDPVCTPDRFVVLAEQE